MDEGMLSTGAAERSPAPAGRGREMKLGLRLPSFALGDATASLAEMGAYLRRAEDLGFESGLVIDHLLVAPPAYRVTWLEPLALLSALAGVTRTMRLGTLVLVLPFRDPVALAKEWATFDVLSGGRSIFGVGVGWNPEEFGALRIPITERGRRTTEMLEAITALWSGDQVSYEGRYYQFRDLTIEPTPRQRPHPPIWIGGGTQPSEKIYAQKVDTIEPVLRRIAKYATAWVPHSSATAGMVRGDWARIRDYMGELGRDPEDLGRVYSNFVHVLRPGERPEEAERLFRVYSGMDLDYWREFYLLGEAEEVAERIRGKIEVLGGVDQLILNPLDWDPENLERLAADVLPLVTA
jgi:probable F420-dependent oxidoreductase